jgi:hypothetical protein
VAEDAEDRRHEALLDAVAAAVLGLQEADERLRDGQAAGAGAVGSGGLRERRLLKTGGRQLF